MECQIRKYKVGHYKKINIIRFQISEILNEFTAKGKGGGEEVVIKKLKNLQILKGSEFFYF